MDDLLIGDVKAIRVEPSAVYLDVVDSANEQRVEVKIYRHNEDGETYAYAWVAQVLAQYDPAEWWIGCQFWGYLKKKDAYSLSRAVVAAENLSARSGQVVEPMRWWFIPRDSAGARSIDLYRLERHKWLRDPNELFDEDIEVRRALETAFVTDAVF
jgi:hypothetical protein